jgi:hypothetical protein
MSINTLEDFKTALVASDAPTANAHLRYLAIPAAAVQEYQDLAGRVVAHFPRVDRKHAQSRLSRLDGTGSFDDATGAVVVLAQESDSSTSLACALRVVTNPADDAELAKVVRSEVQEALGSFHTMRPSVIGGLARVLLEASGDPVLRRVKAVVETTELLAVQKSRVELQVALSENDLGRINGVSLEALAGLTGDDLAGLFAALAPSYPDSTPSGSLYYVVKKGTSKEEFAAFYDAALAANGWSDEGLKRVFALTRCVEHSPSAAEVKAFSDAPAQAFLDFLEANFSKLQTNAKTREGLRRLALSEVLDDLSGKSWSVVTREEFDDILAARPSRPLAEIASDEAASEFEKYSALAKARNAGLLADDPHVAAVYGSMAKVLRITMVRQGGERQKWAADVLMAADLLWKAERAAKAARTASA